MLLALVAVVAAAAATDPPPAPLPESVPTFTASSTAPVPSTLPRAIDIATPTQAVNTYNEFALDGGLLYTRKVGTDAWTLVDGVGLPNLMGKVLPEVKGKLTRVFADGNVVAVVDADDQVFRYDAALHVLDTEPTLYAWRSIWSAKILKLRKDLRSISYGRRTILNVGVVEDRFGDKLLAANPSSLVSVFHDNGYSGLMHFYGLSQDGHRLFFADNGLTDVFNYEFDLPRAEDFTGVALASSASMVVVLDSKGRYWAKFLDFDWYGSNPMMFEYSYVKNGMPSDNLEGFGRIHVPLPTWRELPALSLPPHAYASTEMGMVVTGRTNDARALRVRGVDEHGACGLYTLALDQAKWSFKTTGICAKEPFVPVADPPKWTRTKTLRGDLVIDGERVHATVRDYSLVDSPATLELGPAGSPTFRGALYIVPAWSPLEVQDPGRDGRYKLFYATVDADAAYLDSPFSRAHNLKSFELTLYGADNELVVKATDKSAPLGKLVADDDGGFRNEVSAFLFADSRVHGVPRTCKDLSARIAADESQLLTMTSATPALNLFGLVTGTRFWYYHGISMIPPLGRMMEWGTRLLDDRLALTRYEKSLVEKHCGVVVTP